jgi:hypothetical protein
MAGRQEQQTGTILVNTARVGDTRQPLTIKAGNERKT